MRRLGGCTTFLPAADTDTNLYADRTLPGFQPSAQRVRSLVEPVGRDAELRRLGT
ncbi:MAG TPA: hypothetical protein VLA36_09050 [Longimicrobiales bacterium]|nr:hypothetical protein [Longimicrobiales bacterium]